MVRGSRGDSIAWCVLAVVATVWPVLAVVATVHSVLCRVLRVSVIPAVCVCNGVIVCLVALLAYSTCLYTCLLRLCVAVLRDLMRSYDTLHKHYALVVLRVVRRYGVPGSKGT